MPPKLLPLMLMLMLMLMITYSPPSSSFHSHPTRQLPPPNSSLLRRLAPAHRVVAVAVSGGSNAGAAARASSDGDVSSAARCLGVLAAPRLFLLLVHEVDLQRCVGIDTLECS
jgi:hypothetical protein